MKKNSFSLIFLFVLISITVSSCCALMGICTPEKNKKPETNKNENLKFTEATVIDYSEVAGCSFLLQLNNGEKLEPSNLASEFKKDKLRVLIKYEISDMMSVCMAGKVVAVSHIELKK